MEEVCEQKNIRSTIFRTEVPFEFSETQTRVENYKKEKEVVRAYGAFSLYLVFKQFIMKVNIMKRSLFFIAAVAAAAVTGAVVAWGVSSRSQGADAIIAEHNSDKPFASGAGAHFTAYEPQEYPDLTYAAENAVKAVHPTPLRLR